MDVCKYNRKNGATMENPRAGRKDEDKRASYYWNRLQNYGQKYKWFHWRSVELFINLIYTYDVVFGHLAAVLKRRNLSRSTFNILNIISRSEKKGCTHKELSELLLVSRANVTGLVDGLMRRHLVEQVNTPEDRRLRIVKLTKKGKVLLNSVVPVYYLEIRKLASSLSNAERDKLNRMLAKLRLKALDLRGNTERKLT
jgi:MarR family 2-MHQ and catechol resistance regulon transcriptional repressor